MNSTFNESDPNATRLLIIDDDAKLAGLLRDYLEPLGYVIDLVHNGKDALQLALQSKENEIDQDFQNLEAVDKKLGQSLETTNQPQALKQKWLDLKSQLLKLITKQI